MMRGVIDLDSAFEKYHGLQTPRSKKKVRTSNKPSGPCDIESHREKIQDPSKAEWVEEPIGFKTFCEDKEHMDLLPKNWEDDKSGDGALSKRQYKDCMAILGDDPKKMFDPATRKYVFGCFLWSKGSGKDYVCSILHAYIVYIILCLRNPQDFFGFAPGEACDILNVGKKGQQAERVYFNKFRSRILNWKWMLKRYNVTDEGKRANFLGRDYPYCKIGTRSAEWSDKNVRAFAENSGNPQAFEGYNIIFYICDEISGWMSDKERTKASEILSILRTSQGSRNTKTLTGLGMAISYPRQDDDIMFKLEKEAQEDGSTMYFSKAYQWEVKPKRFYSGNTFKFNAGTEDKEDWFDIPVELDKGFFESNPEKAKMIYLLIPPAVQGAFFEYVEKIEAVSYPGQTRLFKTETEYIPSKDGKGNSIYYVREKVVGLNKQPDTSVDYVAWIDAGETTCDASLSIGHYALITVEEGSEKRDVPAVILDDTLVWEPDKQKRRIVDIGSMTAACIDMLRYIDLKAVWWDQWNSGTGVFDLRNAGITCDRHNLGGSDYDFFKSIIYSNRFIAPEMPETDKAIGQIKHLIRTRTGNADTGSPNYKKDVADTWCGITTLILGALSSNLNLRMGRAPISITGGRSTGTSAPNSHLSGKRNNPFSSGNLGKQIISNKPVSNHNDMFPGLGPLGGKSRSMVSNRLKKTSPSTPRQSKFPRGRRL
jgi:hypothetical protein